MAGLAVSVLAYEMIGSWGQGHPAPRFLALLATAHAPHRRAVRRRRITWLMMIFGICLTAGHGGGQS